MSVPVYRLAQIFGAVSSHHKVGQGHEYERIGRVQSIELTPGLARTKVLNNMGRYYDVIINAPPRGKRSGATPASWRRATCPDPIPCASTSQRRCSRSVAGSKRTPTAFQVWMGISADDNMGPGDEPRTSRTPVGCGHARWRLL